MSKIGPPPGTKKKSGFGCQCSIPWPMTAEDPATTRPILPSSIIARANWCDPPRNVSGAQPTRNPPAAASARNSSPSAMDSTSGFSLHTCLPACNAALDTPKCASGMVRLITTSTAGLPSKSSTDCAITPYSSARATAAAIFISAQARTSRPLNIGARLK